MKKYTFIFSILLISLTGCNFLDTNPDTRAEINTKEKVQLLLVNAYPSCNPYVLEEMSSDNMEDNNSPDETGNYNSMSTFGDEYNEMFAWQPVTASRAQDTPYYIWNQCYMAIAAANHALEAIATLEASGTDMSAEKGEALLCRAYGHFLLATIFCKAYRTDELSQQDMGIPYADEPEKNTKKTYTRPTLTETYKRIQADLEAALPIVSDSYYSVPKYHFNTSAAYAFACRFYLYTRQWDKCIAAADRVLGDNPSAKLFDAYTAYNVNSYPSNEFYTWIDGSAASNLLLTTPATCAFFSNVQSYGRYQFTRDALLYTVGKASYSGATGPCWNSKFPGLKTWSYASEYGVFISKQYYVFEYKDKVAGTGVYRGVIRHFTTNETLLNRAEAKIMKNDLSGALQDLNYWVEDYNVNTSVTMSKMEDDDIKDFYWDGKRGKWTPELHNADMTDGEWTLTDDQLQYVWCVLHFRRIESIHEGLRWQDIKRYGIEIEHAIGNNPTVTKKLVWDDDRRAIQLPQEVILQGLTANPMVNVGDHENITSTATASPMTPTDIDIINNLNQYVIVLDSVK